MLKHLNISQKSKFLSQNNRYNDDINHDELFHENQKKAIEFLKKQKKYKTKKENERKKLIERKKQYQEKIRQINKEKLHKQRKRNSSSENMNSDIKHLKQNITIRSKSEEMRTKGIKINRRFARERIGLGNYSDAKVEKALIRQHYNIKTISVDDEINQNTISDQCDFISDRKSGYTQKHTIESKVAISVDLASKMNKPHKEILTLKHIDNSEQKSSLEHEDDTKYMKTPELNMNEKYSHKHSDNKYSARSTEKEDNKHKDTTRCHSSQKKKSIKVAKEIQECKKDLAKLQKISEFRKNKFSDKLNEQKSAERRKQNLDMLNDMLKRRNQDFKKKKRNQEKLLKKDLANFEKSVGVSFNKIKKKQKKLKLKNMKRNQTFSCLSSKGQCDTLNTSKHEICTEEKKKSNLLELKISIKKSKNNQEDCSISGLHSPNSKRNFSSNKKVDTSNNKKFSGNKRGLDSTENSSSSKIHSMTKLTYKNSSSISVISTKNSLNHGHKKRKNVSSEAKKDTRASAGHQFNDISEIQEFNITDEESLMNASILKNIEDHESIGHPDAIIRQSTKNRQSKMVTNGKSVPTTIKKTKTIKSKQSKKPKFISSAHKNLKTKCKTKKGHSGSKAHHINKRKVIFHMNKQSESLVEHEDQQNESIDEHFDDHSPEISNKQQYSKVINIETRHESESKNDFKEGQIKKVEFVTDKPLQNIKSEESIDPPHIENYDDYLIESIEHDQKNLEKIDIINSEKLSELLSSKKKNRYCHTDELLEEVEEEHIGHHINFDDSHYEGLHDNETSQNDNSRISLIQDSHDEGEGDLLDHEQNSVVKKNTAVSFGSNKFLVKNESVPTLNNDSGSSIEDNEDPRYNLYNEFGLHKTNANVVIESLTYEQQCHEHNDIIAESVDDKQTVINCTQSNEHTDENTSDRNIIAEEFSLEYEAPHHRQNSWEDTPQVSMRINNDSDAIHETENYAPDSNTSDIKHNEQDHESFIDNTEEDHHELDHDDSHNENYSQSEDYHEDMIKEISEDNLYSQGAKNNNERKYFNNTLTNMRIAFGSEQQVRENSVKTLEKMEFSHDESGSSKKHQEEKSSIFEKKSFQDFSLKKFTELMQVKNMKEFQDSMQKTFREYNKAQILSMSDKKSTHNKSSTPKKAKYISPRKFSKRDLELDRIGYEHMKMNSEHKKNSLNQIMSSNSSIKQHNNTTLVYNSNLSMEKYKKEMTIHELSEDAGNSLHKIDYKILSPRKRHNASYEKMNKLIVEQPTFESPEASKSFKSKHSSCKKITVNNVLEVKDYDDINETPNEDENIETVKLDSSRLRSQKRGLPMDQSDQEETPKNSTKQKRGAHFEEIWNTGEKYVLSECFTDEKIEQLKLRNAVTSAKKINPIQIMKNMKSPGASSYISSAKKALIEDNAYDDEPIKFELSDKRDVLNSDIYYDKENQRTENVSAFPKLDHDSKPFSQVPKLETYDYDYDNHLLDSPDRSHKHSKSRSRTKEKKIDGTDLEEENFVQMLDLGSQTNEQQFLTNVKRKLENSLSLPRSPTDNTPGDQNDPEETSKSLEWIIAKDLDKKQRETVSKLIGDEETTTNDNYDFANDNKILEIEEVKRVQFGNSMIRNNNIGYDYHENSNLGQYVECLESVESSNDNSVRAVNEREILRDKGKVTEYLTDEILSMMLFNDIHDCPMHPIRETNFIDYFKDKYPFNRELGIDTSSEHVYEYIEGLMNYIKQYHMDTVIDQLKKPIYIDPLKELSNLQALDDIYNDETHESENETDSKHSDEIEEDNGEIVPHELFYEYEQIRKNEIYQNAQQDENDFTEEEIEDKIKFTFIHDKAVFEALFSHSNGSQFTNGALSFYSKRKETARPWIKETQASYNRNYSIRNVIDILNKAKWKMNEWLDISAGTRKVPPPSLFDALNNWNDNMNDTIPPPSSQLSDEERLQQLREERLSLLLSREIHEEDTKWNEFGLFEIQTKLDLADMALEHLVWEIAEFLVNKQN